MDTFYEVKGINSNASRFACSELGFMTVLTRKVGAYF